MSNTPSMSRSGTLVSRFINSPMTTVKHNSLVILVLGLPGSERAAADSRHVSYVEGAEGLENLENYIQRGINPLNIDGPLIKVDTTDFSKVNETRIIRQIQG